MTFCVGRFSGRRHLGGTVFCLGGTVFCLGGTVSSGLDAWNPLSDCQGVGQRGLEWSIWAAGFSPFGCRGDLVPEGRGDATEIPLAVIDRVACSAHGGDAEAAPQSGQTATLLGQFGMMIQLCALQACLNETRRERQVIETRYGRDRRGGTGEEVFAVQGPKSPSRNLLTDRIEVVNLPEPGPRSDLPIG